MSDDLNELFKSWQPNEPPREPQPGGMGGLEPENRQPKALLEKEVKVRGVFEPVDPSGLPNGTPHTFVLLEDRHDRKVPIWIGLNEAHSISNALQGEAPDRPMTHDFVKIILQKAGLGLDRVIIDDLWNETFYAKLILLKNGEPIEIDCRPSDAVAMAVRFKAPIYMAEHVIEQVVEKYEE